MNTKTIKSKIKMLQIPVTEKEFDILKAKADKEKRSLPNSIKIILEPFLKPKLTLVKMKKELDKLTKKEKKNEKPKK